MDSNDVVVSIDERPVRNFAHEVSMARAAAAQGVTDPEKEFRDKLVRNLQSRFPGVLEVFMAKSDEFPRFVWQHFFLSVGQELAKNTLGKPASKKFSEFIDRFLDIFQRELLRDSFFSRAWGHGSLRYGELHAAVVSGRTELVYLLTSDHERYREKICTILSTHSENLADAFHLIRRALLWRNITNKQKMSAEYAKVAAFMTEFHKARKPTDIEALRIFMDQSIPQIDLTDAYDPWIVILAWSSVCPQRDHIINEFRQRNRERFDEIVAILRERGSAFSPFLVAPSVDSADPPEKTLDFRDIVTILVLQTADGGPDADDPRFNRMHRIFLDRFCERTPIAHWTPLHLAAARGDNHMVQVLIKSWDMSLEREENKKFYTKLLNTSFYDAKHMTPLHYAVLSNQKDVVGSLLEWEMFAPHVNACDIFMRTALHIASSREERLDIVECLLGDSKIEVNIKDCCNQFTAVHWAVYFSCTEIAVALIGSKPSIAYNEGLISLIREHAKQDSQKLLLTLPTMSNVVEKLYKDRQVYVQASNAILVGAALIASVTFGGWLLPPLGNERSADSIQVNVFWSFIGLAFFFAIATVMAGAGAALPVGEDNMEYAVQSIRKWLLVTACLLIFCVFFVLGAFATAGFSASSGFRSLRLNMIITTTLGIVLCSIVGDFFWSRLLKVRPDWLSQIIKDYLAWRRQEIRMEVHFLLRVVGDFFRCIREPRPVPAIEPPDEDIGNRLSAASPSAAVPPEEYITGRGFSVSSPPMEPREIPPEEDVSEFSPGNPAALEQVLEITAKMTTSFRHAPVSARNQRIREQWEKINHSGCRVRQCYQQLQIYCRDEILRLSDRNMDTSYVTEIYSDTD